MPVQYESPKLKSWASVTDAGTILQAEKCARLPFVYDHVALMPDAHVGMGATVGSVIPTEGAIIPAAVGVDIGCVDRDSEYLSPAGWRKISQYDGGLVMQYEPFAGTTYDSPEFIPNAVGVGHFVQPEAFIVKPCDAFLHLRTKYGIDQMVTADHRVLCWRLIGRDRNLVMTVLTAAEFAAEHDLLKQGFKARFATTFVPDLATEIDLTAEEIRVQVMVNADGHLDHGGKTVVRLKKERKIERARKLLANAGIDWKERTNEAGVTSFYFTPPLYSKSYQSFWPAHLSQLMHLTDECLYWDGNAEEHCFYTRDKESADFMHYAFTACGRRAVLRADKDEDGKLDYRVFRHDNIMISMGGTPKTPITMVPAEDGKAYCFTVPSGFWVMRRGGNIVMTGNCGMIASLTNLTDADLPDNLDRLMELLEGYSTKDGKQVPGRIPAGVGQGHDHYTTGTMRKIGKPLTELTGKQETTAYQQFGTLGSGNHFVEVCVDDQHRVWTVLHSGSRGIGNQLANVHIRMAKAQKQGLEDPDLAYFLQGTPEFNAYIHDMMWAQDYAFGSRQKMANALNRSLFEVAGWTNDNTWIIDTINCHHNFTIQEKFNLPGGPKLLWITRKGAIQARTGDRGVIPGSMGTKSYIVRGKGVSEAWCSCSHGAGRRMSRSQAKRELSTASLEEMMKGKTWNSDHPQALVDEHPLAYKDIDVVMADQADLVEVEAVLSQVFNYKGQK